MPKRVALVIAAAMLAYAPAASAADRVIGLLSLPEVFGRTACDKFTPEEVALYEVPDGQRVGSIRVDRYWTFHPDGGCAGLVVNVHRDGRSGVSSLPTREFEYEAPAVVVLERRRNWFRVRLSDGSAWLKASSQDEFFTLEQLLRDRLGYLTEEWDQRLASAPAAPLHKVTVEATAAGPREVRVVEFRRAGDELWVHVEVLRESGCVSQGEPVVVARGWVRALAASGEPAVWFHARGC